jgi:starvation-inducible DNA-binding protein
MSKAKSFPTRIDLSQPVRDKAVHLLNQHLADTFDLFSQIKQAHWNVKGPNFYQLHLLFDTLAEEVEDYVDLIAERVTTLAGIALGTARLAATGSRLPEYPLDVADGRQHLEALSNRVAALAASSRGAINAANDFGDADTADLFTEVSRGLDKSLWFLEAHLQS